jgi:transposase
MKSRLHRHALTDDQWRRIVPFLPFHAGPGRPPKDHRLVIDGIVWILKTGAPWRDLPDRFGPWKTVYERFRGWTRNGVWSQRFERLKASKQASGEIDWHLFMIDATIVRAQKSAAGAGKKSTAGRTA